MTTSNRTNRWTRAASASLTLATMLAAQAACAQAVPAEDANDSNEIIVTAQKREQNLNTLGLTVAVLGGEALKTRQVTSLADLANVVPSLSYTESSFNTPVYTVRGVGFYETSISAYPTVSLYLDEVPLAFPVMSKHSAFDLQRVEVLKGPQGTLFGQNATGGAINFIAAKPSDEFGAGATIGYSRFNTKTLEAYVNGPLAPGINARLSGRAEHGDGWQVSNSRPHDRNGKVRNYMGRLLLDMQPTDALRIQLNLNGWKDKSETVAPQYIGLYPQFPLLDPRLVSAPFSPEKSRAADWTPGTPYGDNSFWQASARIDLDLTDDITVTSLTAYSHFKQSQGSDQDGLPIVNNDAPVNLGKINSFYQELRVSNGGGSDFRWIFGGNLERSNTMQNVTATFPDSGAAITIGSFGFPDFGANTYIDKERLRNYAVFGNAELDVGPLTFKGGMRYTKANRSASICTIDYTSAGAGAFIYGVVLGGAAGPYVPGTCYSVNNLGAVPFAQPTPYTPKLNQDNLSYRVGVDWKASDRILVYANVAKGYKAGSYPTLAGATFKQYAPVVQESVMSYEGGFKASLLDRTLQLNGAAFFYDYKDKQIRAKIVDPVFGVLDALQNIPKSQIKGFELEATVRPDSHFTFGAQFTYLDAKVKRYTGISGAGVVQTFDGAAIPYTPKYQVGLNADYTNDISDTLTLRLGSSLNFRSKTVAVIGGNENPPTATPAGKPLFGIDDYATVDLRAGIGANNDRWRLDVWGKNVFNTYYWTNVNTTTDTIVRYAGMPATYGVTIGFKY